MGKMLDMKRITSYHIDNDRVLHTFVGNTKHITFSNIDNDFQARQLILTENIRLLSEEIEKPYQVYNSITNSVEGYFDNEFEAKDFANQFEDAKVYDLRL